MSRWPASAGTYSDHVAALVGRIAAADARLEAVPREAHARRGADAARRRARASVRLDASPLSDVTADAVDARLARGDTPVEGALPVPRRRPADGWSGALRLDGMATQEVAAVEYGNALAAEQLVLATAERLLSEPRTVLEEAHAALCQGLVDPRLLGRLRRTEQAIHDGAQGRILYRAEHPDRLEGLLTDLARWIMGPSAVQPAAVVAATVHERLLEWQPYEAANGRLARLLAHGVRVARGLDRSRLAVPEAVHADDPSGYWGEVAATCLRRGDLVRWLERDLEALALALEDAVAEGGSASVPAVPARGRALVDALAPGQTVTLKEYAEGADVALALARTELDALRDARALRPVMGARGLAWRRPERPAPVSAPG